MDNTRVEKKSKTKWKAKRIKTILPNEIFSSGTDKIISICQI